MTEDRLGYAEVHRHFLSEFGVLRRQVVALCALHGSTRRTHRVLFAVREGQRALERLEGETAACLLLGDLKTTSDDHVLTVDVLEAQFDAGLRRARAGQIRIVDEGAALGVRWHVASGDVLESLCASRREPPDTHLDDRSLARAIVPLRSSEREGYATNDDDSKWREEVDHLRFLSSLRA